MSDSCGNLGKGFTYEFDSYWFYIVSLFYHDRYVHIFYRILIPFQYPSSIHRVFFVTFPACFQGPRADGHHLWRSILPSVPAVPAIPQTLEVALAEPWDERIFRSEHRKRLWMQPLARDIKLLRGDIYKYNNIYIYIKNIYNHSLSLHRDIQVQSKCTLYTVHIPLCSQTWSHNELHNKICLLKIIGLKSLSVAVPPVPPNGQHHWLCKNDGFRMLKK